MSLKTPTLKTPLGRVKGLGSAKHGVHHWIIQRLTAVALIPLVVWFVLVSICFVMRGGDLAPYLQYPMSAIAALLFVSVALYHGSLGMQVVLEDYVHCHKARAFSIILMKFITIVTILAGVLAVVKLHLVGSV